jgi:hypothetical protein
VGSEEIRLLAVREVTGRFEAILAWVPDAALLREAEGTELHLSSHVLDYGDGRVIIFDGPRAVPCQGREGRLAALALEIPHRPGRYRVQIEPVVEGRFWGSQRGWPPLELGSERRSDGSVLFEDAATTRQYILNKPLTSDFSIDTLLYGLGDSERCIEIPWVLSRYRGELKVLDIGYANAEPRYLQARDALNIPLLVGMDLAALPQPGIFPVTADALALPFRHSSFDLILAISAIEHIGRDNSIHCDPHTKEQRLGCGRSCFSSAAGRTSADHRTFRPPRRPWLVCPIRPRTDRCPPAVHEL